MSKPAPAPKTVADSDLVLRTPAEDESSESDEDGFVPCTVYFHGDGFRAGGLGRSHFDATRDRARYNRVMGLIRANVGGSSKAIELSIHPWRCSVHEV